MLNRNSIVHPISPSFPHTDAHAVCGPGLTPWLGLSSWPARYTFLCAKCYTLAFSLLVYGYANAFVPLAAATYQYTAQ